jgi:hypothetical protein
MLVNSADVISTASSYFDFVRGVDRASLVEKVRTVIDEALR